MVYTAMHTAWEYGIMGKQGQQRASAIRNLPTHSHPDQIIRGAPAAQTPIICSGDKSPNMVHLASSIAAADSDNIIRNRAEWKVHALIPAPQELDAPNVLAWHTGVDSPV